MSEEAVPRKSTLDSQHLICWSADDFRRTMILIAKDPESRRTPAHKRPDTITLDSWSEFLTRLWDKTAATGREHGRFVLVDVAKESLVMSKEVSGDEGSVMLKGYLQPGREHVQLPIGSIHTHPETPDKRGMVFSAEDYVGLLGYATEQFMVVQYGPQNALLLLKTTGTPALSMEQATRRVKEIYAEFIHRYGSNLTAVIEFNKMVCVELGLTLYRRSPESGETFRRIEVTH